MVSSFSVSSRLYGLPLESRWPGTHTSVYTLAFMPDQLSQVSVAEKSVLQEDGPSAKREVSSVYWSRLVVLVMNCGNNPGLGTFL